MKTVSQIGNDTTLAAGENGVYVVVHNGDVEIHGPFEGWAGFATLAEFDNQADGEALARRIEADTVRELESIGYDVSGWFSPIGS